MQTSKSKRQAYPYFLAIGYVEVFGHGAMNPTLTVKTSCYISYQDEANRLMLRDAKYRLEQAGVPAERFEALYFEGGSITEIYALDPKGVKRVYGDATEAFLDDQEIKKRDVLIRQRRLVPYDQSDMLLIYGPAPKATDEGVGA